MKPLPIFATIEDPAYTIDILQMAHGLVEYEAKSSIIKHYTDLPSAKISAIYRSIRKHGPAPGSIFRGDAKFFAAQTKNTSLGWTLQGAIFLECYSRMGDLVEYEIHKGWRLLHAFRAYLAQTQKMVDQNPNVKRLDINQAYSLLTKVGFLDPRYQDTSDLRRHACPQCNVQYLVLVDEESDTQQCPVCAMHQNAKRLASQASSTVRRKRA